jgi:predicted DsbA family dithiol-disulfide isomerase
MHIDIFSDTVCPWCYIGKQRLERALARRPRRTLSIVWRAFQLNPEMPPEGMERQLYLSRKFGGAENAASIYGRILGVGEEENIPFAFDAIARTPNTVDSHRLIRYAAELGHQDDVVQALFEAYFCAGRDIGDRRVLAEIGAAAGLDEKAVTEFLGSGAQAAEILAEDNAARRMGIQGVPCFIIDGRHVLSGAQPPEAFLQMFDVVDAEEAAQSPANQ